MFASAKIQKIGEIHKKKRNKFGIKSKNVEYRRITLIRRIFKFAISRKIAIFALANKKQGMLSKGPARRNEF